MAVDHGSRIMVLASSSTNSYKGDKLVVPPNGSSIARLY